MRLKPREQWICDDCGQVIEHATQGMVEWLHEDDEHDNRKHYGWRIVHHTPASPRNPYRPKRAKLNSECCYKYSHVPHSCSTHLDDFVGPDGLPRILGMIDRGPLIDKPHDVPHVRNLQEWAEFVRRLALPFYEEARLYWKQAEAAGRLDGERNHVYLYSQEFLRSIIDEFAPKSDSGGDITRP